MSEKCQKRTSGHTDNMRQANYRGSFCPNQGRRRHQDSFGCRGCWAACGFCAVGWRFSLGLCVTAEGVTGETGAAATAAVGATEYPRHSCDKGDEPLPVSRGASERFESHSQKSVNPRLEIVSEGGLSLRRMRGAHPGASSGLWRIFESEFLHDRCQFSTHGDILGTGLAIGGQCHECLAQETLPKLPFLTPLPDGAALNSGGANCFAELRNCPRRLR